MLQISKLSLSKADRQILKELSLSLASSKITLFLGKSGSGKTSILRCICQLDKTYKGIISYDGKNLNQFSQKERCQIVGFVPQSYTLFPFMSVLDNCTHPLITVLGLKKEEARRRAEALLDSLEMGKWKNSFPDELSGGQQQRVGIVRALGLNPKYLLLDEPTSALDPENTELLIRILFRLKAEGRGVIISSQDMHFASQVLDDVYFLEEGDIVESYDFDKTRSEDVPKESRLSRFLFSGASDFKMPKLSSMAAS